LKKLPNDQLDSIIPADPENINWRERPEFVLFWDKDVNLARMLEREGFRVFNNADGIEACDDKALTFIRLKNKNIKMPKTFIAPMTFDKEYKDYTFLLQVEGSLGYPMVIKENKGSFGEQVYLVNSYYEAVDKIKEMNFTMVEGTNVDVPYINECPISIECKVKSIIPLGTHDLFIAEVVGSYVDKDYNFSLEIPHEIQNKYVITTDTNSNDYLKVIRFYEKNNYEYPIDGEYHVGTVFNIYICDRNNMSSDMETYGDFLRDISTKDNLYVFCSGPFDVQSKEEFVNDYVELNNYRDTILDSFKWLN